MAILRPVAQVHESAGIVVQEFLGAAIRSLRIDSLLSAAHGDISKPLAVRRPDGRKDEVSPRAGGEAFLRACRDIEDKEIEALVIEILLDRGNALAVGRQDRAIVHRAGADLPSRLAITIQEGKDRGLVLELLGVPFRPGFGDVFGLSLGAQALTL